MTKNQTLDTRVAQALTNANVTAQELDALISEVDTAIIKNDHEAKVMHDRAMDATIVDDGAREAAINAEFIGERYRRAITTLQTRLSQVKAATHIKQWNADADQVAARRETTIKDFNENYHTAIASLLDMIAHVKAIEGEIERINKSVPNSEHRRIAGLGAITQILANLRLPDLQNPAAMLWPPPPRPVRVEDVAPILSSPSTEWWNDADRRDQERIKESQRVAAYHRRMAEDREKREAEERKAAREAMLRETVTR